MVLQHFFIPIQQVFLRWDSDADGWAFSLCCCFQSMTCPYLVIFQALLNIPHLKMTGKLKVRVHNMQPWARPRWCHGIVGKLCLSSVTFTLSLLVLFQSDHHCVSFVQTHTLSHSLTSLRSMLQSLAASLAVHWGTTNESFPPPCHTTSCEIAMLSCSTHMHMCTSADCKNGLCFIDRISGMEATNS